MPTNRDIYKPKQPPFNKEEAALTLDGVAKFFAARGLPIINPLTMNPRRYVWNGYHYVDLNVQRTYIQWMKVYYYYITAFPIALPKLIDYYGGIQSVITGNQIDAVGNALNDEIIVIDTTEPIITEPIPIIAEETDYTIPIMLAIGLIAVIL